MAGAVRALCRRALKVRGGPGDARGPITSARLSKGAGTPYETRTSEAPTARGGPLPGTLSQVNPPTAPTTRTAIAVAALVALTAVLALIVRYGGFFTDPLGLFWWYAACWTLFAAALLALRRVPASSVVPLLLAGPSPSR